MDNDYIEIGLVDPAPSSGSADLLYEGHKVVPYCPRCGTALSSHEVAPGLQGRRRPVGLRRASRSRDERRRRCWSGRRRRGRCPPTRPSPSTPRSTYVRGRAAADERLILGRGRWSRRVLGRGRSGRRDRAPVGTLRRPRRTSRRSPTSPGRAPRSSPATSSRPTTAPASSTSRPPSARTTSRSASDDGLAAPNPVDLRRAASPTTSPLVAGRVLQGRRPGPHRRPRGRGGRLLRSEHLRALLPALLALRHPAALLREAVLVHPDHRRRASACWRENERDRLAPRARHATGASASGSRTTSTGRSRATATGARRCRSGAATTAERPRRSARSPSCASGRAGPPRRTSTRTGPSSTTIAAHVCVVRGRR